MLGPTQLNPLDTRPRALGWCAGSATPHRLPPSVGASDPRDDMLCIQTDRHFNRDTPRDPYDVHVHEHVHVHVHVRPTSGDPPVGPRADAR